VGFSKARKCELLLCKMDIPLGAGSLEMKNEIVGIGISNRGAILRINRAIQRQAKSNSGTFIVTAEILLFGLRRSSEARST
jgi:hypothetical protein